MDLKHFKARYEHVKVQEHQNNVSENPMVSICVQTYQHVDYIKACLDGILNQETNFSIEVLLGEDSSTDGTREICIEYAKKHPEKIRLFLHHRENNIFINGKPSGRFNFMFNLLSARGKYIALCEGDDYWTDPLKLQKQVDFMEANPDFSLCFHKVDALLDGRFIEDKVIEKRYQSIKNNPITVKDLIEQGNFIHTASVFFRNILLDFPMEFKYSPVGDYLIFILLGEKGFIKRLDESMAVYRRNVGIYSTLPSFEMKKKIIMYQSCVLSYLEDEKLKEKLLQKQISLVGKMKPPVNTNEIYNYYKVISWSSILKLFLLKTRNLFVK